MGIDIYMSWDGMSDAEREAQYTGWSIVAGDVGYLREAYHGGPYVTQVLFPETWGEDPVAVIEFSSPSAEVQSDEGVGEAVAKALQINPAGHGPANPAPDLRVTVEQRTDPDYPDEPYPVYRYPAALLRERLPAALAAGRRRLLEVYNEDPDSEDGRAYLASFEAFVALAEQKEAETGAPVTILNSY